MAPPLRSLLAAAILLQLIASPAHAAAATECDGQAVTIVGTENADAIDGTDADDVILGLGGDDVVRGFGGDDSICGGLGNDVLRGGPGADTLVGDEGNDILRCGSGHDGWIEGGDGDDELYGERSGPNDLIPGSGDDLIVGSIEGGGVLFFDRSGGAVVASLITGTATGEGTDSFRNIDALYGSAFGDTLIGTDGDDGLIGRAGNDMLIGNGGSDSISGQQGDDVINGGEGFDIAEYYDQEHADEIDYGPMNVNLRTGAATGDGNDTLIDIEGATGSDGVDTMIGDGKANSFFWLFGGDDTIDAGAGNDFVAPGSGANVVAGGKGIDTISMLGGKRFHDRQGGITVDLVAGTSSAGDSLGGFENVFGSVGNDVLIGDSASNTLSGYYGNDVLIGHSGDDKLIGQGGRDRAKGGNGTDRCGAEVARSCESKWVQGVRARSEDFRPTAATGAATIMLATAPASATYRGKNGRIAFATDTGNSPQVVKTVKPDGSDLIAVAWNAVSPKWAPDGTKIVFTRMHASGPTSCSIEMSNPDGSGAVDLTGGHEGCDSVPSFTPDGRAIVFLHGCDGCRQAIWRMDLQGGSRTRIRGLPSRLEANDPNVAPDGRAIAFEGAKSDTRKALFIVKMNGSHLRRITSFALNVGYRIDWAPNGAHIVFTEYQNAGPGNIALVRPDGSGFTQVTYYAGDLGAGGAVYSPDGRWLLYRRQNNAIGKYSIWRMHPDGSQRTRIGGIGVLSAVLIGGRDRIDSLDQSAAELPSRAGGPGWAPS
jgi:Ca2+-binding RTX toxin-like protein